MPEINDYAREGLRTLMFAFTPSDSESNYSLLGITGVEDLLQDNVKTSI
jgi:magnesium-transporting ATPase (P-type)